LIVFPGKICDFGEAKVLKSPALVFEPPLPWKDHGSVIDPGRFQKITAQSLMEAGAEYYCWLHPGETTDQFGADAFPHGALVYLFRERIHVDDRYEATFGQRTPSSDCVFAVAGVDQCVTESGLQKLGRQAAGSHAEKSLFPDALTPFHIIQTTELNGLVTLDLQRGRYRVDLSYDSLPPQVQP
jgi:hypothetical protein